KGVISMAKLNKKTRAQYTKAILDSLNRGDIQEFRDTFLELHPSDQSDIFRTLEHEARSLIYTWLSPKEFAAIFENLDIQDQKLFFQTKPSIYQTACFVF